MTRPFARSCSGAAGEVGREGEGAPTEGWSAEPTAAPRHASPRGWGLLRHAAGRIGECPDRVKGDFSLGNYGFCGGFLGGQIRG